MTGDPLDVLTRLDQKVLAALDDGRSLRASKVIDALYPPRRRWEFDLAGHMTYDWVTPATADQQQEVREILSGLAHLGVVRRKPGGWWAKCS